MFRSENEMKLPQSVNKNVYVSKMCEKKALFSVNKRKAIKYILSLIQLSNLNMNSLHS